MTKKCIHNQKCLHNQKFRVCQDFFGSSVCMWVCSRGIITRQEQTTREEQRSQGGGAEEEASEAKHCSGREPMEEPFLGLNFLCLWVRIMTRTMLMLARVLCCWLLQVVLAMSSPSLHFMPVRRPFFKEWFVSELEVVPILLEKDLRRGF